jgi:predicted nuclease of predicted toxin-antitoxin system
MKFLANENFPYPSIKLLRDKELYVKSVNEERKGITDKEVIDIAKQENLVILTFDKDYGELIFRYGMPDPPSVVFFRYKGNNPSFAGNRLINLLSNGSIRISKSFIIVEENDIRQRQYG